MEFNRKFYAATPPAGGGTGGTPPSGPSDQDLNRAEKLNELFAEMRSILGDISVMWRRELNQQAENLDATSKEIVKNLGRELYSTLQGARKETTRLADKTSELRKNVGSSKQIQEKINETVRRQNALQSIATELVRAKGHLTEQEQEWLSDATKELQKQEQIYKGILRTVKAQEKAFGALGATMKLIGGLPFIGTFIAKLTQGEKVLDAMKKKAQEGASGMRVFAEGVMQLGTNISVGLLGLLVKAFESIIKLVIEFNQKTFDLAKNLGVSVEKAGELQQKFMNIAYGFGILRKEVAETYGQLTNALGFLVPATTAFAGTAALIQKRLGASAEQMAALASASVTADKSLAKTYGIIQASAKIEGARNKLALTQRQILEGIAKTSATVLLNFRGDLEALSAAIVRATKLGTSLEQVNKQASGLLDFETSIANEIEATVITGRETNLNRARELAMLGKTRELMDELKKQGVDYLHFSKLNTFEKEAEAKRIGLTIEEYSKMLLQQKQANDLGAKEGESLTQRYEKLMKTVEGQKLLNAKLSESELADLRKLSIQDKFNNALEKFKEIIGSTLQGPVTRMLEKFIAFVSNTEKMQKLADQIKGVFEGIERTLKNLPGIMNSIIQAAKVIASLSVAAAVARVVMAAGTGGWVGLAAGLVTAGATYAWLSSLVDKATTGGGGGAGTAPVTEVMVPPVNSAAAAAEGRTSRAESRGEGTERGTASAGPGHVYLDGQKVGQIVLGQNSNQLYGLNMA